MGHSISRPPLRFHDHLPPWLSRVGLYSAESSDPLRGCGYQGLVICGHAQEKDLQRTGWHPYRRRRPPRRVGNWPDCAGCIICDVYVLQHPLEPVPIAGRTLPESSQHPPFARAAMACRHAFPLHIARSRVAELHTSIHTPARQAKQADIAAKQVNTPAKRSAVSKSESSCGCVCRVIECSTAVPIRPCLNGFQGRCHQSPGHLSVYTGAATPLPLQAHRHRVGQVCGRHHRPTR